MLANELLEKYRKQLNIYMKERERLLKIGKVSSKVKNKIKYYKNSIENIERNFNEINKLGKYKYYIVEVSYGNCIKHKVVIRTGWNPNFITIFNASYEEKFIEKSVENIPHFKIIRELTEMN